MIDVQGLFPYAWHELSRRSHVVADVLVVEHNELDNSVLIPFYPPKIDILQTMSIYVKEKSISKA
jgi:hypothetical protein